MPMGEGGTYWIAKMGDKPVGGIMSLADLPAGAPTAWFPYIEVDDVDRRVEALTRNGGALARPLFDIPGIGRIAIVQDATGAMAGWMTPKMQS